MGVICYCKSFTSVLENSAWKKQSTIVRLLKVNHISICSSCKYENQSRSNQEETHCLSHRFRCLFLYLVIPDGAHVPGPWEQLQRSNDICTAVTLYVISDMRLSPYVRYVIWYRCTDLKNWLVIVYNDIIIKRASATSYSITCELDRLQLALAVETHVYHLPCIFLHKI